MKKKIIMVIGFMILILLASNLLAAGNLTANLGNSVNELKGGETLTITLRFNEYQQIKNGLNAYQATLEYNKNIFEEVQQEDFQCLNDWEKLQYNQSTGELVAIKKAGSTSPEDIVSITLTVKPDVKATTTDIKIKDIITSEGEKDITIAEAKTTINIIEEQQEKPEEPKPEKVTSDKYTIEGTYIKRILPNTTVSQFKNHITLENVTTNPQMELTDRNGVPLTEDSLITTGTKIKIGKTLQYTLIVIGDTDFDGEITINDIAELKLHIIEKQSLDGIKLQAGDIDNDGEITINDLAQMKLILIDLLKLE